MSQYIITIVPVADEEFAGPAAQTLVRIDIEGGDPAVTEVIMRAPEGSRLAGSSVPYVDFEMLLRAFIPRTGLVDRPLPAENRPEPPHRSTTATPRATAAKEPRDGVAKAARSGAAKAPRASAAKAPRTGAAGHGGLQAGRVYRRSPDPAELEAAYNETGTISGVAEHFGVPVHTAQGWISRLRRKNTTLAND